MTRRIVGIVGAAVAALSLLGCQSDPDREPSSLLTLKASETDTMAALWGGTLEIEDGCVYVTLEGDRATAMWPSGTTLDLESPAVVLTDGRRLVPGDTLQMDGGFLAVDTAREFAADPISDAALQCIQAGKQGDSNDDFVFLVGNDPSEIGPFTALDS
ncbi:MAG: hypothetical protein ABMA25_01245 [Ilumatobacteraceae bacterium]